MTAIAENFVLHFIRIAVFVIFAKQLGITDYGGLQTLGTSDVKVGIVSIAY
jgi:hypothetical protein